MGRDGKTPFERLRGKQSRLIGLEFGEKVNFRRTAVGARMAKLDSLWSDGVLLGCRSISGEIVVGTESGVIKTRTVQRKAYEHRWNKENMDMVGGVPWKVSPSEDSEEGIMPAVDIGMEMPEVGIPRAPKEDRRPVPRRLYIRAKDIDRHGVTPNCKGCIATLRGEGGVPHSDTCRKRLTDEIEKSDEGARAKSARQRELDFCDRAVMESDHQAKRKFPAANEEDLTKIVRAVKESTTTFPSSSSSSTSHSVGAGSTVRGEEQRGEKRAAQDPPADCGQEDPFVESEDLEGGKDTAMDSLSFLQEYCDTGGLWMVACREPEEDLEGSESVLFPSETLPAGTKQDVRGVEFWDDRTGKPLDSEKVRAARAEELRELDRRVWVEADVQECWNKKGRGPKAVRWVYVDKGFGVYRSRLVAEDFKLKSKVNDQEGLFAATPPLELVKMIIVKAAKGSRNEHAHVRKVMFLDVSKAHLFAPMLDEEFVQLPPERWTEGKCARLIYTLYGMRTAARNWEKEYSNTLEVVGFRPGRATLVASYHPERDVRTVVHGDDFVVEGKQSDLESVRDVLAAKYILKVRCILGPDPGDQKSIVILGRVVEWRKDELWWEADPRHVEKILQVCGLVSGNQSVVPGAKLHKEHRDDEELAGEDLVRYRSVVATSNFIAQDRPDVRFAVKELYHEMARPTCASWRKLKKLARYLKGQPRVVQKIKLDVDGFGDEVKIIVDSDWAGCTHTRRSTNGGCIIVGDICMKAWSTTQRVVALSSGEAEYYAAVKGASECLGFLAGCADLGIWADDMVSLRVLTDSSACKGICQRTGLGKIRHIDVALLWLQYLVRKGRIRMGKIPGKDNPADLLTKYLPGVQVSEISRSLGFFVEGGRSDIVDAAYVGVV